MKFSKLCAFLSRTEAVSSRLEMTDILAELFGLCDEREAAIVCYLIGARVAPLFIPIEFRVAEKSLKKAVILIVRKYSSTYDVEDVFRRLGDLGEVIEDAAAHNPKRESKQQLTIVEVYDKLWDIALLEGTGSSERRQRLIVELVESISPLEGKYILRILSQKLRLGAGSKTVIDALSVLKTKSKVDRDELERAYGVCADLGYIAQIYRKAGVDGLKRISVTPGIPVFSMLVEREPDAESIMKRIPEAIVQPKYDGIRCQIHIGVENGERMNDRVWWKKWNLRQKGSGALSLFGEPPDNNTDVKLFSRNLEDMTDMFPDIVKAARRLPVKSAVLDAEIVGYREESDEYVPFQETMTRKRKYNIARQADEVPVRGFVFDVLSVDGEGVIHKSNKERLKILSHIITKGGVIYETSSPVVKTAKDLMLIFEQTVSVGLEGVVVKDPGSYYEPGTRSLHWIKLKRASQGHLADTVDVVILGYYQGRGKQALLGIGALLGGVYDEETDRYVTLAKIGTGITEDRWRLIKKDLDEIALHEAPRNVTVNKALIPYVWVKPEIVATVEADEITRSPIHSAGATSGKAGYALRFPRLKEWNRDRIAEDSTTVGEIVKMAKR